MTSTGSKSSVLNITEDNGSIGTVGRQWSVPRSGTIRNNEIKEEISRAADIRECKVGRQTGNEGLETFDVKDEHPVFLKSSKRALSTSNDSIYERDRFRARLQTLNQKLQAGQILSRHTEEGEDKLEGAECEICGTMGLKTAKITITSAKDEEEMRFEDENSPLDPCTEFYQSRLAPISKFHNVHRSIDIRSISFRQLEQVFHWYFNQLLPPTSEMFPWLHGLHNENFTQRLFFMRERANIMRKTPMLCPQKARFLMCVKSSQSCSLFVPILRNTVNCREILQPIDVGKSEVNELINNIVNRVFAGESLLVILELQNLFYEDCLKLKQLPLFLNLDPVNGISLRNFHIQVSKVALYSDFVVYCFESNHFSSGCNCANVARILWLAQKNSSILGMRKSDLSVFIADDFNFLELFLTKSLKFENFPNSFTLLPDKESDFASSMFKNSFKLDNFSLNTLLLWDIEYPSKERIETTKMSSATKLNRNVWVGNNWDFQLMLAYLHGYPIKISKSHAINIYCDYRNSITTLNEKDKPDQEHTRSLLDYLPSPKANWRLFVHCSNDASFPDLFLLGDLLLKYGNSEHAPSEHEYVVLEFPPSGSIGIGDCRKETLLKFVNTCKVLYLFSSSSSNDENVFSTLIDCSDGYTELSLLVLSYLMYSEGITLQEAILELHLKYGRPYYIFNNDVGVLLKLQIILNRFSPAICAGIKWSELEHLSDEELNDMLLSRKNDNSCSSEIMDRLKLGYIVNESEDESDFDSSTTSSASSHGSDALLYDSCDWVRDIEGSLPSRILPYLYLGSLKHANNLTLLPSLVLRGSYP